MEALSRVTEIMRAHGASGSPEEFHAAVNVVFHKFESEVYDEIHRDMWESLPKQFGLLASDCLRGDPDLPESLDVLDIGCGTGLASDCLFQTELKSRIRSVDLLDTSASMLARASKRGESWNVPVRSFEGLLGGVAIRERYDLIVTCSVLHHIPDLPSFLAAVRRYQVRGGVFMHLQDPNGDYLSDPELQRRQAENPPTGSSTVARLHPRRVLGRLYRELTGKQGDDYISKTNRELLERGVLKSKLSVAELFSITDIHVHDGEGISIAELRGLLPEYSLASQRSYGFLGQLESGLTGDRKKTEQQLIAAHALNGFHVGAAWVLTTP